MNPDKAYELRCQEIVSPKPDHNFSKREERAFWRGVEKTIAAIMANPTALGRILTYAHYRVDALRYADAKLPGCKE